MSEALVIEGISYAPLTVAAKHFGYTREYLLMHIHDEKFDARKIGNRWYVNLESARTHFSSAEKKKKENNDALRTARKAEYVKHTKKQSHHHVALVETLAIVVIGLSLGVTGYLGTTPTTQTATVNNTNIFNSLALSLYALVSGTDTTSSLRGNEAIQEPTTSVTESDSEAIQNTTNPGSLHSVRDDGTPSSLIVAPATTFTASDAESLQDSFSDPVTVTEDPNNQDIGVITPVFKEGREGEQYRYLLVPINDNGSP